MVGDCVEANGQGDVCRCADQTQVQYVGDANDDLQRKASHDLRHIHDISDRGVGAVELDQDVGGVGGDYSQDNDGEDSRDESYKGILLALGIIWAAEVQLSSPIV